MSLCCDLQAFTRLTMRSRAACCRRIRSATSRSCWTEGPDCMRHRCSSAPTSRDQVPSCVSLCQSAGQHPGVLRNGRGNSPTRRLARLCYSNRAPDAPRPHWPIKTAEIAAASCDQSFSARFDGWFVFPSAPSSANSLAARGSFSHSLAHPLFISVSSPPFITHRFHMSHLLGASRRDEVKQSRGRVAHGV